VNVRRDASDASRAQRRTTFVTTAICLIGAAVSIALMVTGRASSGTAVLFSGAAIGFVGGVYSLWATRDRGRVTSAARYEAAIRALCEWGIENYAAGRCEEPPSELNDAVIEAERHCPFWRQTFIDRRIVRELDYWNRIGER
jgi:hypothetical protein